MRIRHTSNDSVSSQPFEVRRKTIPPGTTVVLSSGAYSGRPAIASGKRFEDVVTPQFEKRRAQGEVVINPMLAVSSERSGYASSASSLVYKTWVYDTGALQYVLEDTVVADWSPEVWVDEPMPLLSDLDPVPLDTELNTRYDYASVGGVESALLAQCLSKASTGNGVLALVTAAELPKTLDMIHAMVGSLASLLKKVKTFQKDEQVLASFAKLTFKEIKLLAKYTKTKGRGFKRFKNLRLSPLGMRRLASLCGLWLGYRYGIMATYYDVMSWTKDMNTGKYRIRYVSTTSTSYENPTSRVVTSNSHQNTSVVNSRFRSTVSSAGCLVTPTFEDYQDSHGAGRILSTGWELLPLSFVLDWVYDVSTRIAALETSFLCSVKGTWIVHRSSLRHLQTLDQVGKTTYGGSYPYVSVYTGVGSISVSSVQVTKLVQRKANPAVSYLPSLRVNLNWKRLADGIALTVVLRKTLKDLVSRL